MTDCLNVQRAGGWKDRAHAAEHTAGDTDELLLQASAAQLYVATERVGVNEATMEQ